MGYLNMLERALEPPEDRRRVCYTCSCCGGSIREGDEYWDLSHLIGYLCDRCVDDAHHYDAELEVI